MNGVSEARLFLIGWNFRVASGAVRDRVAFNPEEVREALQRIVGQGLAAETVIVSTCHRSEIYGLTERDRGDEEVRRVLAEWRGLVPADIAQSGFLREGPEAARHLFRVAAGLDSMALGESEVLGQVRQALQLARESGTTRAVLHRLFESAMAAGKRVRSETQIGMHPLSVTSIGLELAAKVFGDLSAKTVLVLGAGDTGRRFALQASEAGARDLLIANRTLEKAEAVAKRIGGAVVPWERVSRELSKADVVVGTTASPTPVVLRRDVEEAMRERRGRPMFFLDLAVPADIDPEIAGIYNTFVYAINDLEQVAEENRRRRAREVPKAEAILEEELARFLLWFGNLSVTPTIADLKRRLEEIRDGELARLPAADRERLRGLADSIVAKLLHEPMRRLKSETDPRHKLDRVEAVRHLFDLDRE
ncbi:MAG TPA: glutamyl-tRNA reductase [Thermoanaerobaculia bacterium]|nr:glutamyl-tRNA reductase [Thermoanaerobaculia bacterium]